MSDQSAVRVTDRSDRSRFEITVDGVLAGFAEYRRTPGRVVITHTEIDDAHQGRGLAGRLTAGALDVVRDEGALVTPLCEYTAAYIGKHPQYQDLVDDRLVPPVS
ncbi:GNAT family N-acetyltransferase [Saccharopolyspora sp. NFXS83]|uniref:GNAT family N-acetyltransferase n=1 Tax=Saccharopolyspora sp. NFXS83 TaxID=2993560 RepID=UPI00224A9B6C|nr:GNAT family N-acetyltransferase [Saccharopolyspora sp. NFXS83]MCX2732606.1 GNAT family N-acetyltransferase [Saccharopolyspora sp. NFXS83]